MGYHPAFKAVKFALFALVASVVLGFLVKSLWNALMPPIFGWHMITFWQGLGLFVLSKILFGGFRGRGGMHWRHRMGERWGKMSPEEREKFARAMRSRCGYRDFQPEEQKA